MPIRPENKFLHHWNVHSYENRTVGFCFVFHCCIKAQGSILQFITQRRMNTLTSTLALTAPQYLVTAPGCLPPNALPSPLNLGSSDPSSTSASLLQLSVSALTSEVRAMLDLAHHLLPLTELLRLQLLPYHFSWKRKYSCNTPRLMLPLFQTY